ncbi:MAG: hypothetical protein ISQ14_10890 [Verrucomicrobiae bacterium]|jgi:hypothetical protein|nr:hypothetical protein [Verrucomicrobiae bacterium]
MKTAKLFPLCILGLLLATSGCSSFNREWKASAAAPRAVEGIEGAWDGTWLSGHNGHTGRLRAIVTRLNDDEYYARFHATYMRVLTFGQAVNLRVAKSGTNFTFSGSADLGKAYGGVYSYTGNASPEAFFSTYDCSIDHGTFRMKRPE